MNNEIYFNILANDLYHSYTEDEIFNFICKLEEEIGDIEFTGRLAKHFHDIIEKELEFQKERL